MALFGDTIKGTVFSGLAIGIGAAVIVPAVLPVLVRVGKPLAKAAMKSGLILYNTGREMASELEEIAGDLWAEAKAEAEEEIESEAESEGEEEEMLPSTAELQEETGVKAT